MKLDITDTYEPASRLLQLLSRYTEENAPEIRGWRRRLRKYRHRRCRDILANAYGNVDGRN